MAIRIIKLPDVGEGVTEAELAEILVKPGDVIREDDPVAAVMTDKATVEITSVYSGTVAWVAGEVGDTLAVGAPLLKIETDQAEALEKPVEAIVDEAQTESVASKETGPAIESRAAPPLLQTSRAMPPRPEGAEILASPAVRARARDGGIDLRQVRGTGPVGRITQADLDALFDGWSPQPPTSGRTPADKIIKVNGLRRKFAERMSEANRRIPHITVVEEVDVTDLEALRQKMNEDRGERPKLTLLPFLVAALVKLRDSHPEMNAYFDDEAEEIRLLGAVHVGIATMTDNGLIVPVLRHSEARGLFQMATEIARLAEACRKGSVKREELTGSTITISSLGPLGALATTPIINRPEVAILGVNRMAIRPSWDGTQFVPRKMMNISASFDHRVIDGWDAALFVSRIKSLLETPAMIFVKG